MPARVVVFPRKHNCRLDLAAPDHFADVEMQAGNDREAAAAVSRGGAGDMSLR